MQFPVRKESNPNIRKYPKEDITAAYEFSRKLYDEFGDFVKAIVLFGSAARQQRSAKGDIDLLVVVDDVSMAMTRDIVEAYRIIVQKLIAGTDTRLHVTSLKLSSFWEYLRAGDPIGMNILRDGIAILDSGFFEPMRALLVRGRIRPTPEAVWTYFARAPRTVHNARWHVLQATLDLYWAVIDAAHAALMKLGQTPPSPDHAADMLEEHMVKKKLLEKKYADTMRKFYKMQKDIMHRAVLEVSGKDFDRLMKEAQAFLDEMERFINKK